MSGGQIRSVFLRDLEGLGGAGIAASRLARGLSQGDVEVISLFNNSDSVRIPSGEPVTWSSRHVGLPRSVEIGVNALRRLTPTLSRRVGHGLSASALRSALRSLEFDVLHVHAIHNSYWNHATLAALDPSLPVVWTFHDYWGFSPESYILPGSNGEPTRIKPDGNDRAAALERRRAYFGSRRRCRLVANSRDTARQARELLGLPVDVIYYGIPLDLFAPIDKRAARTALRLPEDAFVIGFIADTRGDPVKGFDVLREALSTLDEEKLFAIAIGRGESGDTNIGRVRVRMLGHLVNPSLLAIMYSAADVFVVPSRVEALGMVAMESIACGTPVIGSDVGGIPDVVQEGATGWLFRVGDSRALAARLSSLVKDRAAAASLQSTCRSTAARSWDLIDQAKRYRTLYEELIRGAPLDSPRAEMVGEKSL